MHCSIRKIRVFTTDFESVGRAGLTKELLGTLELIRESIVVKCYMYKDFLHTVLKGLVFSIPMSTSENLCWQRIK